MADTTWVDEFEKSSKVGVGSRDPYSGLRINSAPPRLSYLPVLYMGTGEKKPILATSWKYGFLLSFSRLKYGNIVQSGGAEIDGGPE